MNNQNHGELIQIVQKELTRLASVVTPSLEKVALKNRYSGIAFFILGLIISGLLYLSLQLPFNGSLFDIFYLTFNLVIAAVFFILGISCLRFHSQEAIIKYSAQHIARDLANHNQLESSFSVSSSNKIILNLNHRKLYFKTNELHIIHSQIDQQWLLWAPRYRSLSSNGLIMPFIAYCDKNELRLFKEAFASSTVTENLDD